MFFSTVWYIVSKNSWNSGFLWGCFICLFILLPTLRTRLGTSSEKSEFQEFFSHSKYNFKLITNEIKNVWTTIICTRDLKKNFFLFKYGTKMNKARNQGTLGPAVNKYRGTGKVFPGTREAIMVPHKKDGAQVGVGIQRGLPHLPVFHTLRIVKEKKKSITMAMRDVTDTNYKFILSRPIRLNEHFFYLFEKL